MSDDGRRHTGDGLTSTVAVNGAKLDYRLIPATSGREDTLVFLHEGMGSISLWRDFPAKVAAATGWRALVYSRQGYGFSDPAPGERTVRYLHDEAEIVLPALLDRLGIADPVLVGHSDGASIALIHAGATARAVRGLVVMAPHVFVEDVTVSGVAEAKVAFETTDLADRLRRHHRDPEWVFWSWNRIWLDPAFRGWNIESVLPAIACPVLAIQGLDDAYGTPAQIEAIERGVGGRMTKLLLAGCGHSPQRDQEAATVGAIAAFVGTLEGSGR